MPLPLVFLPEQQSFFKPVAPSIVANRDGINRLPVNGGDCTRRKELRQVDKSMGTLKVCKSDWQSDPRKELKKQISVNHDFGVQELAPAGFDGKPSDSKVKPVIY